MARQLGRLYKRGRGVPRDAAESGKRFRMSAALGLRWVWARRIGDDLVRYWWLVLGGKGVCVFRSSGVRI